MAVKMYSLWICWYKCTGVAITTWLRRVSHAFYRIYFCI